MALTPGTRLGPYEILSAAGAGGMGEVYRARDTRLERTVAIKVLPEQFTQNPDLKQRFEREAKAISSLNHPNICTLHDVGHQDGTYYLVMEYIEGESLSARLVRGPLPVEQVLKTGCEIAEALERAHRQGIVHRDLKPGNVMLTKSGAKLLDFGLAKPQGGAVQPGSVLTQAITQTSPASPITQQGHIVGTFQYMSPEQVEGKEADARSDIFALGAVLYEMATGKRAFEGKSAISVASAILEREPEPISRLQPMTPPALEQVVKGCLAKDSEERFQTAHDVKLQLKWIAEGGSSAVGLALPVAARRKRREWVAWGLAAAGWVGALVIAIVAWTYAGRWRAEQQVVRTELTSPAGATWYNFPGAMTASADGRYLAFIANDGKVDALWAEDLLAGTQRRLEGTEGAMYPFWSPDGRRLGFFQNGKLKTVAATGGPIEVVCDAADGRGGAWSPSGWIVFTPTIMEAIYKVPEGGGTPVAVIPKPPPGGTARNPYFLPDGRHFLYVYRGNTSGARAGDVYAGSLEAGEPKLVLEKGSNVQYYGGYLVFFRDGNLVAQKFDPARLQLSGNPVPLAERLEYWPPRDMANFTLSQTGLLFYRQQPLESQELVWVDGNGKELGKASNPIESLAGYVLSRDGRLAAVVRFTTDLQTQDVWLLNFERKTLSKVTLNGTGAASVVFSPDSSRAVFAHSYGGRAETVLRSLSGSGEEQLPLVPNENLSDWSRDGRYLFITVQNADTKYDIYAQDMQGDHKLFPVLKSPAGEQEGTLSPNGKWLAYRSDETGQDEVYVSAFPGPGAKWQVSNGGGGDPQWSRDGKTLFYLGGERLMAVEVSNPETMQLGATSEHMKLGVENFVTPFQVAPDGKRFLVNKRVGTPQAEPVHVIAHWTETLKK